MALPYNQDVICGCLLAPFLRIPKPQSLSVTLGMAGSPLTSTAKKDTIFIAP